MNGERALNVAIFGATGLVGREIVSLLEERGFPVGRLLLFASEASQGESVELGGESIAIEAPPKELPEVDVAFLCATGELSREVGEELAEGGALVVDLAAGGIEDAAPLLAAADLGSQPRTRRGGLIVRVPNPVARMIAVALRALAGSASPRRAIATAVIPASAYGREAVDRLSEQTIALLNFQEEPEAEDDEAIEAADRPPSMAFQAAPEAAGDAASIGARVAAELPRLLGFRAPVAVSAVRAPIFSGLAVSLSVELASPAGVDEVRAKLREAPSLVVEESSAARISTHDVLGADGIYIVGLRHDGADPAWIHFWLLADNVRQGAALAAVSLAEGILLKH